jgi:imidazolonepropionase-like amidohydrolase
MTSEGVVLQKATVIIRKEKIELLNGSIPPGAKVIDGSGKWLIPGLIDMHVHVPTDIHFGKQFPTQGATIFFNTQDAMTPYVTNGVTTIFEHRDV